MGRNTQHVNPSNRLDSKGKTPQKKGTTKNRAMAGSDYYYPDDIEKALERQASLNEKEADRDMESARERYKKTKKGDSKKYGFK